MKRMSLARLALATLAFVLAAPHASAQIFRAYLALDGSDANPCTLQLPCRLLPAALGAVASGGEIWMLDSANFNTAPVAITKSVTILSIPGQLGSIVALGGNAIDIAAGGPYEVTLRNLNILPFTGNAGQIGVAVTGAHSLTLQGCNVFGFSGGIGLYAEGAIVTMVDSVLRGNLTGASLIGGVQAAIAGSTITGSDTGVYVNAGAAVAAGVSITRSTITNSGGGVFIPGDTAGSTQRVAISDSLLSGNGTAVFGRASANLAATDISLSGNTLTANFSGLDLNQSNGGVARALIGGNNVSHNVEGLVNGASVMRSLGNNAVQHNTTDVTGAVLVVPGT